ncbi:MFS transporter [Taibaiella koreensis]|uniref:MFS transporter n=1 Tax=Taibaiella koreensis TaxID=1268548 RepID=UPI000E59FCC6|nr:MFS transporter [Taibaiella koreensis]
MNQSASLPTQRYYRIAVSVFYFIQGIVFASWASRIPDIQARLQLNDAALGGVLFAMPAGQLLAMMLSGYLVSRNGSKAMLTIGVLLYPLALVLLGWAAQVWQLSGALFLFGITGNLCNISVNTQGVQVERLYRRSIMASFHGLWSLAGFVGGLTATAMVAANIKPWPHFSMICLLAWLLALVFRRYLVPRDAGPEGAIAAKKRLVRPDAFILTLGLIAFACMICEGTMFDWTGIYFEKIVRTPKALSRVGYIAFTFTMAGGRFISDALVARYGVKRILQASGITIVAGMLLAVLWPQLVPATIGFLLVGIGTSSVVPLVYSVAGRSKNIPAGLALALVSSIGFLGFLLGPPLIGFLSQATDLRVAFAFIALLGLGTTLLARRLNKLKR